MSRGKAGQAVTQVTFRYRFDAVFLINKVEPSAIGADWRVLQ
jgi:hypothetical protein